MPKFVVVTGGVVSGLGKGITISSIGVLLKAHGVSVTVVKIDPYLNLDAGTLRPLEHGECFVTADGGETDLDIGNYERFCDISLTRAHNLTTGKVYDTVIRRERAGDYLGATVQVIPHVTDLIKSWIQKVATTPVDGSDAPPAVCLVEVGGTVGDIESVVFLEALRQLRGELPPEDMAFFHVSLVPVVGSVGEQKTKPTQHSVRELRSTGIAPDFLVTRSSEPVDSDTRAKLGHACQVPRDHVVCVPDVASIFHVPLVLADQRLPELLFERLKLTPPHEQRLTSWRTLAASADAEYPPVRIALVGKYCKLHDAYLSVTKALNHACLFAGRKLVLTWVSSEALEEATKSKTPEMYDEAWAALRRCDGVLVPGGFGDRGCEGKIAAVRYARTSRVPLLGVCLGMQCMVIEFARSLGLDGANSTEFNATTPHPVVIFMPEGSKDVMGGTMRLGARTTHVTPTLAGGQPSLAMRIYGAQVISERHRHRYEVNPEYVAQLESAGLLFTGRDDTGQRMEIVELPQTVHPYFVGTQYHPEYQSRPHGNRWSPPFLGFILASCGAAELESRLPLPAESIAVVAVSSGARVPVAAPAAVDAPSAVATPSAGCGPAGDGASESVSVTVDTVDRLARLHQPRQMRTRAGSA